MRRGATIVFFIGLFFVFGIGFAVYFLVPSSIKNPKEENGGAVTSILPEGVDVIEKNGKKVLRDERVGYEIEVSNDLDIKTREGSVLFYSKESVVPVLGAFRNFENNRNLTLEEWLDTLNKEEGFTFYDERQKIKIGEVSAIKIKVEGEVETYEYFFKKDNNIVGISLPADNNFNQYIQSIKLIK